MDTPYEKLLARLAGAEVKFIIVGGVAVALNNELRNFGEGHARKLTPADFSESEGAIRIIEDFPLDVYTMMRGKRYADLVGSTKYTRIDDVDVRYLDAEALIALKSDSQRDQDRIDVSALRSLQNRSST